MRVLVMIVCLGLGKGLGRGRGSGAGSGKKMRVLLMISRVVAPRHVEAMGCACGGDACFHTRSCLFQGLDVHWRSFSRCWMGCSTRGENVSYVDRAREVFDVEMDGLARVRDSLGVGFDEAVLALLAAMDRRGKVVVTGMGKSLHVGLKLAATFTSTGTPATTLHPSEAMHGDLGIVQPADVVLALSYSGSSDELLSLLPLIKRLGVPIIGMTGVRESPLGQVSDILLPVTIEREACPFNMAPTTSTTAMLAMGDALAMVLLEARGFHREDYAKLHPGGSIGRSLLVRVQDIMRKGERLALVPEGATIEQAVLAMTAARSGSVAIVDGANRLMGIFTDGDLRRHFSEFSKIGDWAIDDVMTRHPITVSCDALAVDVLRLFESHHIDDLAVVDAEGMVVGMVDIQDLPKLKIL